MPQYDSNNIFAKILRGDIPANKVFEDEWVLAFHDVNPAAPVHVLVIPKTQHVSFEDFTAKCSSDTIGKFFERVRMVAEKLGLQVGGYRLITNYGKDANQSVPHFHVHILGGANIGPLVAGEKILR